MTDPTLKWMFRNLPSDKWTLEVYVQMNWMGEKTVKQVLEDPELVEELPEELYPEPATNLKQ